MDADIAMANIGILLGVERTPITLHNVLMGENDVRDAVYEGPNKVRFVPASLSLDRYKKVDFEKLAAAVRILEPLNDYVIIDCPPGLGADAEAALKSAERALLVLTPDPSSLADALKIRTLLERNGTKVVGIVKNMVRGEKSEITNADIENVVGGKVIAELPEDPEVRKATALQIPVVIHNPIAPFSKAMLNLSQRVAGERLQLPEPRVKKGFIASILDAIASLFKRKAPAQPPNPPRPR